MFWPIDDKTGVKTEWQELFCRRNQDRQRVQFLCRGNVTACGLLIYLEADHDDMTFSTIFVKNGVTVLQSFLKDRA